VRLLAIAFGAALFAIAAGGVILTTAALCVAVRAAIRVAYPRIDEQRNV
jgi:hypothetical protein